VYSRNASKEVGAIKVLREALCRGARCGSLPILWLMQLGDRERIPALTTLRFQFRACRVRLQFIRQMNLKES